jgi:hypothetical protein
MMFCVIPRFSRPGHQYTSIFFWRNLSVSQWYLMSIVFDLFCLMVPFEIPNAVELSVWSGVAGWMWPNSVSVTLSGAPLWEFWKHAPTSDSAAEVTTFLITDATLSIEKFRVSFCGGVSPQKKIHSGGCVHLKLKGMRNHCGCAESCLMHHIG